jgi:hypothetical protein
VSEDDERQQRDGWSHQDLLRMSHPKAVSEQHNKVYRYAVGKETGNEFVGVIEGFEKAKKATTSKEIVSLDTKIEVYKNSQFLENREFTNVSFESKINGPEKFFEK